MQNMISLKDAMVIFTTPEMLPKIEQLRAHAPEATLGVPMTISEMYMAKEYDDSFWATQHALDHERHHHVDPRLYMIWNEKSNLVKRTVDTNPFASEFFAWVDIGYFRSSQFNGKEMLANPPSKLTKDQVLMLDVRALVKDNYVGGGFIGGYAAGIQKWHAKYYATLQLHRQEFIGKDQPYMWLTCKQTPGLCMLVVPDNNHGDAWFYMAPYMIERELQL